MKIDLSKIGQPDGPTQDQIDKLANGLFDAFDVGSKIANEVESEEGDIEDKLMVPAGTKVALEAQLPELLPEFVPEFINALPVGTEVGAQFLGVDEDGVTQRYIRATEEEAISGEGNGWMDSERVNQAIEAQRPYSSEAEAIAGEIDNKGMSPLRTRQAVSSYDKSFVPQSYGALGDGVSDDTASFIALAAVVPAGGYIYIPSGTYIVGAAIVFSQARLTVEFARGAVVKQKSGTQTINTLFEFTGADGSVLGPNFDANTAGNPTYTGRGELLKISGNGWVVSNMTAVGSAFNASGTCLFVTGSNVLVSGFKSRNTGRSAIRNKGDFNVFKDINIQEWAIKGFVMDADAALRRLVTIENFVAISSLASVEEALLIDPDTFLLDRAVCVNIYIDTPATVFANNIKFAYVSSVIIKGLVSKHPATSANCSLRFQQNVIDISLDDLQLDGQINFDIAIRRKMRIGGRSVINKALPQPNAIGDFWGDLIVEDGVELRNYTNAGILVDSEGSTVLDSMFAIGRLKLHGASGTPPLVAIVSALIGSTAPNRVPAGMISVKEPLSVEGTALGPENGRWVLGAEAQEVAVTIGSDGGSRLFRGLASQLPPTEADGWRRGDRIVRRDASASAVAEIVCVTGGSAANTAWAVSTAYSVGARRYNGANVYRCVTAGTSAGAGGPTGTGSSIADGTVVWAYVAPLAAFKTKATLSA